MDIRTYICDMIIAHRVKTGDRMKDICGNIFEVLRTSKNTVKMKIISFGALKYNPYRTYYQIGDAVSYERSETNNLREV